MNAGEAENKRIVETYYKLVVNEKNFESAAAYFGPTFKQHNPLGADGIEGMRLFVEFLKRNFPQAKCEIKRSFAVDDFVILHVHSIRIPGTPGRAIAEFFRLEKNQIVEHWDVIQDVISNPCNPNSMI